MSTSKDMAESQLRNEFGYVGCPSVNAAPGAAVHSNVDASTNKALPWVALSCILAGLALGVSLMMRPIVEALNAKTKAELRQEFAQDLADVRAEARQAGDDAAIWKNRVMKLEAEANAQRR